MRGHTSFLYTQSLDSIRYLHRITSENKTNVFVLEDETEMQWRTQGGGARGAMPPPKLLVNVFLRTELVLLSGLNV